MRGTLLSSSISRIMKSAGKVNLPTSTSIFLAIPTRYWNDLSANLTLILVGLRVSRDSFAYKEYGIRLMSAPRSAKALQEKVLKLHRIRKLLGSSSFGGTLFWIIVELLSLKKAAKICSILCLFLMSSLRNFPLLGILAKTSIRDRKVYHRCGIDSCLDGNHFVRLNANYRDSSLGRDYDHGNSEDFLHTKPSIVSDRGNIIRRTASVSLYLNISQIPRNS
nr:hypothetical protein [Tanacetum cinerariifolium]